VGAVAVAVAGAIENTMNLQITVVMGGARNGAVGWVELLRNPSAAVDGFRKSSTHPTKNAIRQFRFLESTDLGGRVKR
jgi:hypothetical protein